MIELSILGGLSVAGPAKLGPASTQTRRLAVLALLAHAGKKGLTRDQLTGLLWPEEGSGGARRRLTQAIYALRNDLADDQLFNGTNRLTLEASRIRCDLWDFRRAVSEERWLDAVAAYRGPLLEGVFITGAPEFDRWVETERVALRVAFLDAGLRAAALLVERADHGAALSLYQRLALADPHHAEIAAGLARAMAASGDGAGALSSIHAFGARLREDLGLPLDGRLIALDETIRRDMRSRQAAELVPSESPRPVIDPILPADPPRQPAAPAQARFSARRLASFGAVAASVAIALGGLSRAAASFQTGRASPEAPVAVAVLPFAVIGDSSESFLAAGAARLIAEGLDRAGPIRASIAPTGLTERLRTSGSRSDSAAAVLQVTGAHRYVTGWATRVGETLRLQAAVHQSDRDGLPLGLAITTGPSDSLFSLADEVSRKLGGLTLGSSGGLVGSAAIGTTSLAAFKGFVEGESHFRASRFPQAVAAFERAVREDSTFGMVHYRLSQAYDWNAQGHLVPGAAAAARRFANRLPWRERMLLEGATLWRAGQNDSAEVLFRAIATRYPTDAEAWFELGEVLFHGNTIRGRPFREAGPAFARVLALDPGHRGALTHLARVEAYTGNGSRADSLIQAAGELIDGGPDAALRFIAAVVTRDRERRAAAVRSLTTDAGYLISNAATWTASYLGNLAEADSIAHLMILGPTPLAGHSLTALFAYGQGQPQRAFEAAAAMAEFDHANSLEVAGLLAILPAPVALDSIREALTRKLRAWRVGDSVPGQSVADRDLYGAMRLYYLGMLAVRREEWAAATGYADSLESFSSTERAMSHARGFAAGIRAHRAAAAGDRREALRLLGQVNDAGDQSSQSRFFGGLQSERYLRATLLEAAGRDDEALAVYESLVFGGIYETVLPGIASLHRGRILGRLGRRAEAIAEYRKFLDLWRSAERWGRPVIDSAVAELARIERR